ncbi:tryptophan dimethylallyltransferase-domain-containing protein [Pterulicium gracile]|uniref:Tryptophan dimethylallyltransferase-domain-containing protein n=1 Tax=Pterulicium gracile TaxID=1884261 RepID=A0A5C3R439_9AGAR|nr:tryptophan dimethylallyltransferase-domain-containing protein [Pterula gracilis]
MNTLVKDERYIAQIHRESVQPVNIDFSADPSYENVAAVVHSLLGIDYEINSNEELNPVKPSGTLVYDWLSQILQFKSSQSKFFWKRFDCPYASKLQMANYTFEAQTKLLVFIFARLAGILGPDVKPNTNTMLTADGSTCEGSWLSILFNLESISFLIQTSQVTPSGEKPDLGDVNRDPRNVGFLRSTKVLQYVMSTEGGLGLVVVDDDNKLTWLRHLEKFVFSKDEDPDSDYVPPGTGFYLGLIALPSGLIALKSYYQCPAASAKHAYKSPLYVNDKDFSPLAPLVAAMHPSLVAQFQVMLNYFGGLEDRLKPLFHMLSVDIAAPEKNRLKIYFQTIIGLSFNDVKRNFTLGGRLDTPQMHESLELMEILWNELLPQTPSTMISWLPINSFLWYYELSVNASNPAPKGYFPAHHLCKNDLEICKVNEKFYKHPAVNITGPTNGKHGKGWVAREIQKAYIHRPLETRAGITTWITFGHKHRTGFEMMAYFSSEQWAEEYDGHDSDIIG